MPKAKSKPEEAKSNGGKRQRLPADRRPKAVREYEAFWKAVVADANAKGVGPLDANGNPFEDPPAVMPLRPRNGPQFSTPMLDNALSEAEQLQAYGAGERARKLMFILHAVKRALYSDDPTLLSALYQRAKEQGVQPVRFGPDEWNEFDAWLLQEARNVVANGITPLQLATAVRCAIYERAPRGAANDLAIMQAWEKVKNARVGRLGQVGHVVTASGLVVNDDAVIVALLTAAYRASCIDSDIHHEPFKAAKNKVDGLRVSRRPKIGKRV